MMTAWDIWQFRNERLHGSAGPKAIAQHIILDSRISEELLIGAAGILPDQKYLITSHSIFTLKAKSAVEKQLWLNSIRIGRKYFAEAHGPPPSPFAQEIESMRAWLA